MTQIYKKDNIENGIINIFITSKAKSEVNPKSCISCNSL